MHPPNPEKRNPPGGAGFETCAEAWGGTSQAHSSRPDVQPSTRPIRCPWFAEVVERAARPGGWNSTAIIHAGIGAWTRATATHQAGRRACTVLPLGADPAAIRWPSVRFWVADAGDLASADAIELARLLIDSGAELVQMVGRNLRPSLVVRRAAP